MRYADTNKNIDKLGPKNQKATQQTDSEEDAIYDSDDAFCMNELDTALRKIEKRQTRQQRVLRNKSEKLQRLNTNYKNNLKQRDDQALNIKPLHGKSNRVYRVEVEKYNDKFSHLDMGTVLNEATGKEIKIAQGNLYNKRSEKPYWYIDEATKEYKFLPGKTTPPKNNNLRRYVQKYLRGKKNQLQGTMSWLNFGIPERALDFYLQKSTNRNEIRKGNKYVIKSIRVPTAVINAILKDTVHEDYTKDQRYLSKPINVDRRSPNQVGLRQQQIALINQTFIAGSERVENIGRLIKKIVLQKQSIQRPSATKPW